MIKVKILTFIINLFKIDHESADVKLKTKLVIINFFYRRWTIYIFKIMASTRPPLTNYMNSILINHQYF